MFRLFDEILACLFQPECLVCGRLCGPAALCPDCRPFYPLGDPQCQRCGVMLSKPMTECGECVIRKRRSWEKARSLLWLEEDVKSIVHRIKYGGRFELLRLFHPSFEENFEVFFPTEALLIPVPIHFRRLKERGFNQAFLLAEWLAEALGMKVLSRGLYKSKPTVSQSTLSEKDRQANLTGSFAWNPRSTPPRQALLVDDIFTTGATLDACARILRRAGVEEVYVWTLFRTPLWGSGVGVPTRDR